MVIDLADEAATAALAEDIAAALAPGDVVAFSGGLGAGKTTLARALIRALDDDAFLEVPSPTFTLVQTYATPRLTVAHFDLYRITADDELDEIGLADAAEEGAVLVEWPERAGDRLPSPRLDIALSIGGAGRRATITTGEGTSAGATRNPSPARGGGTTRSVVGGDSPPMMQRLARSLAARKFLDASDWRGATRRHLKGDASTRTYERIRADDRTAILMDWPPRGQLTAGDPRAAYRARDARGFVAVDGALADAGLSVPDIYAADIAAGFVLLEDFGSESIATDGVPDAARYRETLAALATIHELPRPAILPLPDGGTHPLSALAGDALLAEAGIFADFYAPYVRGTSLPPDARAGLIALWGDLGDRLAASEQSWVLFDVQSPNLFWQPERQGFARVGFIDFQDMFVGPAAYDVASLCQDARVTIAPELEDALIARYIALRRASAPAFDADSFRAAYAVAAALRIAKNLGAFARLASIGNHNYISHLSRARGYLARVLSHPVLSPFALWYEKHLPPQ